MYVYIMFLGFIVLTIVLAFMWSMNFNVVFKTLITIALVMVYVS